MKLLRVSPLLFLSTEEAVHTLYEGAVHGDLTWQSIYFVGIIGQPLVIGGVLAVILILLPTWPNATESLIDIPTALAYPLPGLALLPLIIMWSGTGSDAVTTVVTYSALWPVLVNLLSGFRSVPSIYKDIGRSLSIFAAAITPEIRLCVSTAYLISGLKAGWVRGWRVFTNMEMAFGTMGGKGGIGQHILTQRTSMSTVGLFAGIILVIIVGMLMEDVLFGATEKHTLEEWGMKA